MKFEWKIFDKPQPFAVIHELQKELVEARIRGDIPDTFLMLEHTPVVTRGKGLQRKVGEKGLRTKTFEPLIEPLPQGVEYYEIERGGDLTYHGPGQVVVYPICKLGDPQGVFPDADIGFFIRSLEQWVMSALETYGVEGAQKEGASGVWIGARKICSIGIALRRWVTYHGLAVNITNDLLPFHAITPCGYKPETMVRLQDFVAEANVSDFEKRLLATFDR